MNDEMKKKSDFLKRKNREKILRLEAQNDILYKECIDALRECEILSMEESQNIFKIFEEKYPITVSGHVNWDDFNGNVKKNLTIDFIKHNMDMNAKYYILWDMANIPCVLCDLISILNNIDDVLAVSFSTWLLSVDMKNLLEFHSGITLGIC